jgi:hypothetical protein
LVSEAPLVLVSLKHLIDLSPWLRLCRIGGLTTAITGAAFGVAFSGRAIGIHDLVPVLISACLYTMGMVSNDLLDHEKDLVLRPDRPLPSGLCKVQHVSVFLLALIAAIFALSFFLEPAQRLFYGLCAIWILCYNGPFKEDPHLGALSIGLARACNIMGAWGPSAFEIFPSLVFATVCIYTITILWVSYGEDQDEPIQPRAWLAWGISCLGLGLIAQWSAIPWILWTGFHCQQQRNTPRHLRPRLVGQLVAAFTLMELAILFHHQHFDIAFMFLLLYAGGRQLSKRFPVG